MKTLKFLSLGGWLLISAGGFALAKTNILLNHNDNANDGLNPAEFILTPANVASTSFGKIFSTLLDGPVKVQPLVEYGVNITVGTSQGTHVVVFAATQNNSIYAIDANNGTVLWHTSLLHSFHGGTPTIRNNYQNTTDTPAIDPTTNVLYVESYEVENGNIIHVLTSLRVGTGKNYANPVNIAEGTSGNAYISGPKLLSGVTFDACDLSSRCLTLDTAHHMVYIGYAAAGTPQATYEGWIVGYSTTPNASNNLVLKASWSDEPGGQLGGIWQGGGPMAIDASGNLFVETGDGYFEEAQITPPYVADGRLTSLTDNATIPGGLKIPRLSDYGDSVVKLTPDSDTTQQTDNSNGFGLHVADYFCPNNETILYDFDKDLGSSSPILLPDSVGSSANKQLLVANDKEGDIFLVNRNNMGGYHGDSQGDGQSGTNNVVQEIDGATHGAWCTGAFWTGTSTTSGTIFYATAAYGETTGDVAKAFTITNGLINITPVSTSAKSYGTYGYPGSTPIISANKAYSGILWTLDRIPNRLVAYKALDLGTVLYRSDTVAADALTGAIQVFATPTVANGIVYVGTSTALNAYGLISQ